MLCRDIIVWGLDMLSEMCDQDCMNPTDSEYSESILLSDAQNRLGTEMQCRVTTFLGHNILERSHMLDKNKGTNVYKDKYTTKQYVY